MEGNEAEAQRNLQRIRQSNHGIDKGIVIEKPRQRV
jgi:hypothetical protein